MSPVKQQPASSMEPPGEQEQVQAQVAAQAVPLLPPLLQLHRPSSAQEGRAVELALRAGTGACPLPRARLRQTLQVSAST